MAQRPRDPYVRYRPLKKPPISLHRTTLWDYPSQHYGKGTQGSPGYRGATPSHVIWNVVQRWTKPGALVVDPFCGSGTTLDVCKDVNRKARGFDIAPARDDVEKADARKLPLKEGSVDLVFMDPPYADNLKYSGDPACLGELTAEDGQWQTAMRDVLVESRRVLKDNGVLAIFLCDVLKVRDGKRIFLPLGLYAAAAAEDAGFFPDEQIAVVRRGKTLEEGRGARQADREAFLLRGFNHLLIFSPRT
jgi:adenine-specific DNA-methyltransferase